MEYRREQFECEKLEISILKQPLRRQKISYNGYRELQVECQWVSELHQYSISAHQVKATGTLLPPTWPVTTLRCTAEQFMYRGGSSCQPERCWTAFSPLHTKNIKRSIYSKSSARRCKIPCVPWKNKWLQDYSSGLYHRAIPLQKWDICLVSWPLISSVYPEMGLFPDQFQQIHCFPPSVVSEKHAFKARSDRTMLSRVALNILLLSSLHTNTLHCFTSNVGRLLQCLCLNPRCQIPKLTKSTEILCTFNKTSTDNCLKEKNTIKVHVNLDWLTISACSTVQTAT